jgi:hypothetical protein
MRTATVSFIFTELYINNLNYIVYRIIYLQGVLTPCLEFYKIFQFQVIYHFTLYIFLKSWNIPISVFSIANDIGKEVIKVTHVSLISRKRCPCI